MRFLLSLAWRDLRASGRHLWIFCACLVLGVALVAAGGGLYRQVSDTLRADARVLFGGDVEVEHDRPLTPEVLQWMGERGQLSRLVELRTMMVTPAGRSQLIELQSADAAYPLVGTVELEPAGALDDALAERAGVWGAAVDGALATRLVLQVGDRVQIGNLSLEMRARVLRQPDRSLRANWSGAPVLVSDGALSATGLVQPLSRVEYQYRVLTDTPAATWRDAFVAAFPLLQAEVRTFEERSARMAEVLGQIGSGLLLIGFSALFIGGLGVYNSAQAYLQGKLGTLATLRALGLRDAHLAAMVLLQILMLALLSSLPGVVLVNLLAVAGSLTAAQDLPMAPLLASLWLPSVVALMFGVLTALVFALLSLGTALALLVACTLVVVALLRAVNETVPANAPALVLYDVQSDQLDVLRTTMAASPSLQRLQTAPLVLGRIIAVNGQMLRDSDDGERVREAREEQKFSNRAGKIDDVVLAEGAWWPAGYQGPPLVAMEDREAGQIGLRVGDRLQFDILGTPVDAQLAAIYSQRRMLARLWLKAIFSDGVLDPFITRHVGAAYLAPSEALQAQDRLAAAAPNIISVRTESLLRETRALMARASGGLALVALVCLAASLLVLAGAVAASRARQVYESTVMHALGARPSVLRQLLLWEYALLALVTAGFAILAGSVLATGLLLWRLDLNLTGLYWTGAVTAIGVRTVSLGLGARYLLGQMRLEPALLLRSGA